MVGKISLTGTSRNVNRAVAELVADELPGRQRAASAVLAHQHPAALQSLQRWRAAA